MDDRVPSGDTTHQVKANPTRRNILWAGGGLAMAALTSQAFPGPAAAGSPTASEGHEGTSGLRYDTCAGPAVETFGTASTTAAIVGATVFGGHAYVVTRGLVPPLLAEIDLDTHQVVRSVPLPSGEGGWAATVSGGQVYAGMYTVPDVHRFDPETGEVETVARLGGSSGFVWALTTAPDGTIYAATYPDGGIWEIDPTTRVFRRIAQPVPGAQYARYVAADATHVYASVYTPGRLVAIDRATGTVRNLNPPELGDAVYGPLTIDRDRLVTTSSHKLLTMRTDGSDVTMVELPESEALIDAFAVGAEGTVYATTRRTGSVYRYQPGASELEQLATPSANDEHRAIVLLDDRTMFGAAGSGGVWWLDLESGTYSFVDLIDAGLPPGPERPQAIVHDPGRGVYIGGHWALEVYDPDTGKRTRFRVPGEVKAMLVHDHLLYLALYPSTQLVVLDPATGEVRDLGTILHGQQRPWDMDYDERTGLIVVASAPGTGFLEGALTVLDPRTGRMDVYPGIIDDQAVMSVDAVDGVAYLGGDVIGGGGTPPTQASASVAAFDLRTREIHWQVDPLAGHRTVQDLVVYDGVLYGVMKRDAGTWFAMDLADRELRQQGSIGSYGETFVHRGKVFATVFTGQIHQLGPDLAEPRVVASGLGDQWYTNPHLAMERSWYGWGILGRDLARIRVDPDCAEPALAPARAPAKDPLRIGDVM
ncbi:PQQ-binding-like beta-propeller repeat protein [Actinopolymorpha sp. B9G3]|uniref:outer membrane protein assembly factor BamB family protein n=1 Tax=Actinopolymorpha sp. B9G3 TaxID=3158970 RepID=UPI0032D957B4